MSDTEKSSNVDGETAWQFRLDVFIGLLFLTVTLFALQRCVNSWQVTGGRKVISVFNILIFLAGVFRSIWFLVPNHYWESSYDPLPLTAFSSDTFWQGTLASEIFLLLGTYFLYGIFILIACYWYTMLRKLEPTNSSSPDGSSNPSTTSAIGLITPASRDSNQAIGALDLFFPFMGAIAVLESINILLFLSRAFNEEDMIVFDGIMYIILSIIVVFSIVYLSRQINGVLKNMEIINQSSSQSQIRRINMISMLASFFFSSRAIFELIMTAAMIHAMRSSAAKGQHIHVAEPWWTIYIACKHIAEVLALGFELFISSAIRSYDNSRILARWDPLSTSSSTRNKSRAQATKVEFTSKLGRSATAGSGGSMAIGPANVTVSGGYGAAVDPYSSNSNNPSLVGSKYSAVGGSSNGSGGRSMFYQSVPATPIEGNYLSETSPMLPQPPGISRGGTGSGGSVRGKASRALQLQENSSGLSGSNYL